MLSLSRDKGQSIVITASNGERITVSVYELRGPHVRLAFEAPDNVTINRGEIQERIDRGEVVPRIKESLTTPQDAAA